MIYNSVDEIITDNIFLKLPGSRHSVGVYLKLEGLNPAVQFTGGNFPGAEAKSNSRCQGEGSEKKAEGDIDYLVGYAHLPQRHGTGEDDDADPCRHCQGCGSVNR